MLSREIMRFKYLFSILKRKKVVLRLQAMIIEAALQLEKKKKI